MQRNNCITKETNLLTDFKACHCLLHQQSLCAKHITVEDVMTIVLKIVNDIRAQPLHPREFRLLIDEYNNDYDLLLHADVLWLSGGYVLKRFNECLPQILTVRYSVAGQVDARTSSYNTLALSVTRSHLSIDFEILLTVRLYHGRRCKANNEGSSVYIADSLNITNVNNQQVDSVTANSASGYQIFWAIQLLNLLLLHCHFRLLELNNSPRHND